MNDKLGDPAPDAAAPSVGCIVQLTSVGPGYPESAVLVSRRCSTCDTLAAENVALRAELAFARSTGDESALEYHALKARLAKAEAALRAQWIRPKHCGHEFDCVCAQDLALAYVRKYRLADSAALQCTGCVGVTKPICGHFAEQDDGEGRVSHYCATCGHSNECHEPASTAHSAPAAPCDHEWEEHSDWMGDPEVPGGVYSFAWNQCVKCGHREPL